MEVEEDGDRDVQDWLVKKTHRALKEKDLYEAKCWLITAKSLFPLNFKVQVNIGIFLVNIFIYIYFRFMSVQVPMLKEEVHSLDIVNPFSFFPLFLLKYFSMKLILLRTMLKESKKQLNFFLTCKFMISIVLLYKVP